LQVLYEMDNSASNDRGIGHRKFRGGANAAVCFCVKVASARNIANATGSKRLYAVERAFDIFGARYGWLIITVDSREKLSACSVQLEWRS
jgi:hypothetical protein